MFLGPAPSLGSEPFQNCTVSNTHAHSVPLHTSFSNSEEAVVLLFAAAAALALSTILIVKTLHCAVAIGSKNVHLVIIHKVKSAEEPGFVVKLIQTLWTICCTDLRCCWVKWRIVYNFSELFHNFFGIPVPYGPKLFALVVLDGFGGHPDCSGAGLG